MESANWKTTNPLLKNIAPQLNFKLPFNTLTGFNEEGIMQGNFPLQNR